MPSQRELHERFRALHERPGAFIMPNPWDGASALLMKDAGFEALGSSSSAAIALSLGRQDGRHAVSRDKLRRQCTPNRRVTGLPVNGDLEDGYGAAPRTSRRRWRQRSPRGLAGLGIEDTTADPARPIHDFDKAVARVRAAARAARAHRAHRPDRQLPQGPPRSRRHDQAPGRVRRSRRRRPFAPYPTDMDAVRPSCAVAPKPVNLVVGTMQGTAPWAEVQAAGVKRLILGCSVLRPVPSWAIWQRPRPSSWSGDLAKGHRREALDHLGDQFWRAPSEDWAN